MSDHFELSEQNDRKPASLTIGELVAQRQVILSGKFERAIRDALFGPEHIVYQGLDFLVEDAEIEYQSGVSRLKLKAVTPPLPDEPRPDRATGYYEDSVDQDEGEKSDSTDWAAERQDVLDRFAEELSKATGDGSKKRQSGEKPPWYRDPSHEPAMFSHLNKWKHGEKVDPDSGAHPLVHLAWRALAIACAESGNTPDTELE